METCCDSLGGMTQRLLTLPETAEVLGCSRMHVYRLIQSGALATVDISLPGAKRSKTRIEEDELDNYVNYRRNLKEED